MELSVGVYGVCETRQGKARQGVGYPFFEHMLVDLWHCNHPFNGKTSIFFLSFLFLLILFSPLLFFSFKPRATLSFTSINAASHLQLLPQIPTMYNTHTPKGRRKEKKEKVQTHSNAPFAVLDMPRMHVFCRLPKQGHWRNRKNHNLGLTSGAGALASLFSVTEPLAVPSPKKMTSTVRSSLVSVSWWGSIWRGGGGMGGRTCSVWRRGWAG